MLSIYFEKFRQEFHLTGYQIFYLKKKLKKMILFTKKQRLVFKKINFKISSIIIINKKHVKFKSR